MNSTHQYFPNGSKQRSFLNRCLVLYLFHGTFAVVEPNLLLNGLVNFTCAIDDNSKSIKYEVAVDIKDKTRASLFSPLMGIDGIIICISYISDRAMVVTYVSIHRFEEALMMHYNLFIETSLYCFTFYLMINPTKHWIQNQNITHQPIDLNQKYLST